METDLQKETKSLPAKYANSRENPEIAAEQKYFGRQTKPRILLRQGYGATRVTRIKTDFHREWTHLRIATAWAGTNSHEDRTGDFYRRPPLCGKLYSGNMIAELAGA